MRDSVRSRAAGAVLAATPDGHALPNRRPPVLLRLLAAQLWWLTSLLFVALYYGLICLCNPFDLSSVPSLRLLQGACTIAFLVAAGWAPYSRLRPWLDWVLWDSWLHRAAARVLSELSITAIHQLAADRQLVLIAAQARLLIARRAGALKDMRDEISGIAELVSVPRLVGRHRMVTSYAKTIGAAIALAQLCDFGLLHVEPLVTNSMIPVLQPGDRVLVKKYSYGVQIPGTERWLRLPSLLPRRGDIVAFESAEQPRVSRLSRVIGLPGDVVALDAGEVSVNKQRLRQQPILGRCEYDHAELWEGRQRYLRAPCAAYWESIGSATYVTLYEAAADSELQRNTMSVRVSQDQVLVVDDFRGTGSWIRQIPLRTLIGKAWRVVWSAGAHSSVRTERILRRVEPD